MRTTGSWRRLVPGVGVGIALFATLCGFASQRAEVAAETLATKTPATNTRPGYAGDEACTSCHADQSATYSHTAHKLASQPALASSILGDFAPKANQLTIVGQDAGEAHFYLPRLSFSMERKGDELFETAKTGWEEELYRRSERIDVVTGSGVRGQTYLYWQGDRLFELPVSYWSQGRRWINSPGYVDGTADFTRPVNPGCLECHASYIKATSDAATTNSYVKDTLVTGIGCETCHGPGARHAATYLALSPRGASGRSQEEKPTVNTPAILNPARFTRDLQIDSCAVCHGGTARRALQPAYSFTPGRPLSEFFSPLPGPAADHPDVHGNQVGLLERSKCFQQSSTMSCSTCHDPHAPEKVAASYSEKCLTCHTWQSCGLAKTHGIEIKRNCIDCHMPVEETNLIVSETASKTVRARMRNHWIKVYPATKSPQNSGL